VSFGFINEMFVMKTKRFCVDMSRRNRPFFQRKGDTKMPRMQILTPTEYATFETPPVFTNIERHRFFDFSQTLFNLLSTFRTPTNQICFVLTLGYFRATKRFFARQFHQADAAYVAKRLGFLAGVFDLSHYDEATARRHRKSILNYLGFQPFSFDAKQTLLQEIRTMVRSQARPKAILLHALDILARRKTEIPSARTLTDLIVGEIRRHKGTLTEVIDAQLSPELHELLEALLLKEDAEVSPVPQIQRFKLTLLKKISQSTRPKKIKPTLEDWQTLRELYDELAPIIASLDLTHDGIRYYEKPLRLSASLRANSVLKYQVFQISRRDEDDRHLHLVCFIAHQFYRLQDTLIDILLTVTQNALNTCKRTHKEQYYAARLNQRRAVRDFVDSMDQGVLNPLSTIEAIAFSNELSDTEKIQRIQDVLTDKSPQRNAAFEQVTAFKMQVQREVRDADYYAVLASQSRKLQNRLAELVNLLNFQGDETSELMAAIGHYKAQDGAITQTAPLGFLEPIEQQAVLDERGAIRVPLYKVLLFIKIAQAIKGGVLNLQHSYKYRSLDDYLIPKESWSAHRDAYLQRADLTVVADCQPTLRALATRLEQQYHQTNQRINAGENPFVHFRKDGSFYVNTPKAEEEDSEPLVGILPKRRYISLLEVLATVNRFTNFLDAFEPWRTKYTRAKPPDIVTLPKTRYEGGTPETTEFRAFLTIETIREIGVEIGLWQVFDGDVGEIVGADPTKNGDKISIGLLNPVFSFSRSRANQLSGLTESENRKIVAIGLGALGSQVFMNLVRMGYGQWTLIDDDFLLPHNLSRHALPGVFVGWSKTKALADLTNQMIEGKPIADYIVADVLGTSESPETIEKMRNAFQDADIILDMSTSGDWNQYAFYLNQMKVGSS